MTLPHQPPCPPFKWKKGKPSRTRTKRRSQDKKEWESSSSRRKRWDEQVLPRRLHPNQVHRGSGETEITARAHVVGHTAGTRMLTQALGHLGSGRRTRWGFGHRKGPTR